MLKNPNKILNALLALVIFSGCFMLVPAPAELQAVESPLLSTNVALKKPTLKLGTISYTSIQLKYNADPNADGYLIYRCESKTGEYLKIAGITALSYTDKGLSNNKTYYYKMRSYRSEGKDTYYSDYSAVISAKTPKPKKPKITVKSSSYTALKIDVSNYDKTMDGYQIYRSTKKNGTYKLVASFNASTYTDSGLAFNKTKYYKIRSYKVSDGKTVYSAFSAKVGKKTKLKTPSITSLKATNHKTTVLEWNKIAGANGYVIYRKDTVKKYWKKIKTVTSGNTLSYTNGSLATQRKYSYKIRAYRKLSGKKIYSPYSTVKKITTPPPNLTAPLLVLKQSGSQKVKLSWTTVKYATHYELQRKDDVNTQWVVLKSGKALINYSDSGLSATLNYTYRVRAYGTFSSKVYYSPFCSGITLEMQSLRDGREPGYGFMDGSQVKTKTKSEIIADFGAPTKSYTTDNGELLLYSNGSEPLKYIRTKDDVVVEVYSGDSAYSDMYGIRVGASVSEVENLFRSMYGSAAVKTTRNNGTAVMIEVNKPFYQNAITSCYYIDNNKVKSFRHLAYRSDTTTTDEALTKSLTNEEVAAVLLMELTNDYRRSLGLSLLAENLTINSVAQSHSLDMLVNNLVDHLGSDGRDLLTRLLDAGVITDTQGVIAAETLDTTNLDPLTVFYQWLSSPQQRALLIDPAAKQIGAGVVYNGIHTGLGIYPVYNTMIIINITD